MHGNMVFSTHYILGTPRQSGGFLVCSVEHQNISANGMTSLLMNHDAL